MRWFGRAFITLLATTISIPASACPGFLFIESFGPGIAPGKRKELNLFAIKKIGGRDNWQKIPVQIDPFSDEGKLIFFHEGYQWLNETLRAYDRLSMDPGEFGARYNSSTDFPCESKYIFELRNSARQYAYLAFCEDQKNYNLQIPFHTIQHNAASGEVSTPEFRYRYTRDNHLLFNRLALSYDNKNEYPLVVAEKADQLIRGDVKKFFTFYFNQDDIDAQIARERRGPLGLVGSVDFALRILFFKINLRLSPEVSFFPGTVFMPMVMHLPVDAREFLHSGSGLFYTWEPGRDVTISRELSRLPTLDASIVKAGAPELAKTGLTYCSGSTCRFQLVGELADRYFVLNFNIDRGLVSKGFFPLMMPNTAKAEKELGWEVTAIRDPNRMGMYFETSGLPQGNHEWEFIIRVGDNLQELTRECPATIVPVGSFPRVSPLPVKGRR